MEYMFKVRLHQKRFARFKSENFCPERHIPQKKKKKTTTKIGKNSLLLNKLSGGSEYV